MFGPLNIDNSVQFLHESKEFFCEVFRLPFPFEIDVESVEVLFLIKKGKITKTLIVQSRGWDETFYLMKAFRKKYLIKREETEKTLKLKRILQSLNSPFCVRLEKIALDNSYLYLFEPFLNGGDIFFHLNNRGKFDENLTRFYASQIVLGLEYLHHMSIVHRDIKPENLSIDHLGYVKITNFNLSKFVSIRTYTFCGTLDYIAPEMIVGKGYGKSVDWWALGVLIFEMASGTLPFSDTEDSFLQKFKILVKGKFVMPQGFTEDLQDLLRRLLQVDVTRRFGNLRSGSEDVKFHRWFRQTAWFDLLNRRVMPPWIPCPAEEFVNEAYFPTIQSGARANVRVSRRDKYQGAFDEF